MVKSSGGDGSEVGNFLRIVNQHPGKLQSRHRQVPFFVRGCPLKIWMNGNHIWHSRIASSTSSQLLSGSCLFGKVCNRSEIVYSIEYTLPRP
jgi:hypothetical protein